MNSSESRTKNLLARMRQSTTDAIRATGRLTWEARSRIVARSLARDDVGKCNSTDLVRILQDRQKSAGHEIDADTYFNLVAHQLMHKADKITFNFYTRKEHPDLERISKKMRAMRKKHGFDNGADWPRGEGPEEYQHLNAEYEATCDKITADVFRQFGENEMADLYLNNRREFDRRYEDGRRANYDDQNAPPLPRLDK